jgi:hypothetical protein
MNRKKKGELVKEKERKRNEKVKIFVKMRVKKHSLKRHGGREGRIWFLDLDNSWYINHRLFLPH